MELMVGAAYFFFFSWSFIPFAQSPPCLSTNTIIHVLSIFVCAAQAVQWPYDRRARESKIIGRGQPKLIRGARVQGKGVWWREEVDTAGAAIVQLSREWVYCAARHTDLCARPVSSASDRGTERAGDAVGEGGENLYCFFFRFGNISHFGVVARKLVTPARDTTTDLQI